MVAIVAIVAETDSSLSALKKTSRQPVMPLSSSHSHLTVPTTRVASGFSGSHGVSRRHIPRRAAPRTRVSPLASDASTDVASHLGNPPTGSSPRAR